jgi:SAM-dependent methyltransferase
VPRRSASDRYHDRVARRYDAMYEGDAYWRLVREITWKHVRGHLPREAGARILDAGGGTGWWALRLARSGFRVTLADSSTGMLEAARRKLAHLDLPHPVTLVQSDIAGLPELDDRCFDFALAQGDPISFCSSAERAAAALFRVLRPGAACVASVDGTWGGLDPVLDKEGPAGLERYLRTGRTEWLTRDKDERFPVRTFTPDGLRRLFGQAGFEIRSLIGKTVLPLRRLRQQLEDKAAYLRLLRLETRLHGEEGLLGRAAHLEIAVRRPAA